MRLVSRSVTRPPMWLLGIAALCAGAAAIPLIYLIVRAADAGFAEFVDTLFRARVLQLTLNSVALTLAVTGTCLVIGVAVAIALSRVQLPGGRVWVLAAALPLAVPSYLAAYGWLVLAPGFSGFFASWLVMSAVCVPYVVLPVAAVLRRLRRSRSGGSIAGARSVRCLSRRNVAAGAGGGHGRCAARCALHAVGFWRGVDAAFSDPDVGHQIGVWGQFRWHRRRSWRSCSSRSRSPLLSLNDEFGKPAASATGRKMPARKARAGWLSLVLALVLLSPIAAVGVPMSGLIVQLAQAETIRGIDGPRLFEAIGFTVALALAGAIVAVALTLPIAWLAARYRGRLVNAIESIGYLGHALPGIVVGLSLVFSLLGTSRPVSDHCYAGVCLRGALHVEIHRIRAKWARGGSREASPDVARTFGLSSRATWWRATWGSQAPGQWGWVRCSSGLPS